MKLLVCGGRDFMDFEYLFAQLDAIHAAAPITLLIHGGAWGADTLAGHWAIMRNVPFKVYEARWKQHGKAAGSIRNQEMLTEGMPNLVVAFEGGAGTRDMIQRAMSAGVKVRCFVKEGPKAPAPAVVAP